MIQANCLQKRFGSVTAVSDISLRVEPGQILALLGPNGAGKTTTLRMLSSLLRPTSGTAVVAGYDTVTEPDRVRRAVGLLTELPGLYGRMTAMEYLAFFADLYGVPEGSFQARAGHLLSYFDLWEARARPIGTYSKGMRQKTALVRALLHQPQVILLDEPTSAMDPHSAKTVRDLIASLRSEGVTILICTHNLTEAEALADRIAVIKAGRIIAEGTTAQLKRQLLGEPLFEVRFGRPVPPEFPVMNGILTVEQRGETWLRYHTPQPETANPLLLRYLLDAGLEVVTIAPVPQSLEAVYLGLVEENVSA